MKKLNGVTEKIVDLTMFLLSLFGLLALLFVVIAVPSFILYILLK